VTRTPIFATHALITVFHVYPVAAGGLIQVPRELVIAGAVQVTTTGGVQTPETMVSDGAQVETAAVAVEGPFAFVQVYVKVAFAVRAFDCPVPLRLPPLLQFAEVVQPVGAPPPWVQVKVLLAP
jgi:hypothetical protein